jgi:hypothetical protein
VVLGSRSAWDAARLNVFAIALSALWTPLNSLGSTREFRGVAPPELRGTPQGILSILGIGIAALVQPIAGRASDRVPLPDRRRPFIVLPTLLSFLWLVALWWHRAGSGSSSRTSCSRCA